MPELPEVESARLTARKVAVGRKIVAVWCADDRIVFDRVSPARVRRIGEGPSEVQRMVIARSLFR